MTLRKGVKNPFGIRDNEPGDAKDDDADKEKDKEKDQQKSKNGKNKPVAVKIEFDGIELRAIRVPIEPDDITNLQVGDETLLYLRTGPFYYGRESSVKPTVMAYSIKEREAKPVAEDVIDWSATANGKHVLALMASKELKYFEVGKSDEAKAVPLSGLATTRVPAEEWREIFAEVWRRYRDYFYVENMHGFDWNKLRARYEPCSRTSATAPI